MRTPLPTLISDGKPRRRFAIGARSKAVQRFLNVRRGVKLVGFFRAYHRILLRKNFARFPIVSEVTTSKRNREGSPDSRNRRDGFVFFTEGLIEREIFGIEMGTMYLRRRVAFAAGHAYWLPNKSDEENRRLFGKGASRWGHGHNYIVEATVAGNLDPATGMVVNMTDVDNVLKERVVGVIADKHLSYEVPHFADTPPTVENIARYLAERYRAEAQGQAGRLTRITLWESPTLWATLTINDDGKVNDMIALTRAFDFAAAHRLHAPGLSDAENKEIFGKCNNPKGHGHNYGVEVTVIGEPDPITGMVINLSALDVVLAREIENRFDHKFLNDDTPEFANINPTSENLTKVIWDILADKIPAPARLSKVVVRETDRNWFEYSG